MVKLAFSYAIFAFIAIVANISSQDVVVRLYQGPLSIALSVFIGTGVGLVIKYWLDKQFIFRFKPKNRVEDGKAFLLYSVMGLVTTAIFWGFEFGFEYWFNDKYMRYFGGVVGLIIGYISKYQLDKRFVFRSTTA